MACRQPQASGPEVPIPLPPAAACTSQDLSAEALFRSSKAGVVVVVAGDSQGSGFVVRHQDGKTLLLTNSHVVGDNRSVTIRWADGREETAAVVADAGGASPQTDLALLVISGSRGTPLSIKADPPNVGADVVALGAPKGLEFSLTRGVVSSLRDGGEIVQLDAPINPGNSGGPVLDRSGCVIGMATFKLVDTEGLNFAMASTILNRFLANPKPLPAAPPPAIPLPGSPSSDSGPGEDDSSASGPTTCWFQMEEGSPAFTGFACAISTRRNANGHKVHDVIEPGGRRRTLVLWDDGSAEVLLDGDRYNASWEKDADGDIRVSVNDGVFIVRLP